MVTCYRSSCELPTTSSGHPCVEAKDHLTTLPSELTHLICDYLLVTHNPDIAFEPAGSNTHPPHPLDCLAATSHHLGAEVNNWAAHTLKRHATITRFNPLRLTLLQSHGNFLRGKGGLVTWTQTHCVFCGKKSARKAIFANGLKCCGKCDKERWPGKMTKTAAKQEYDLTDHHLFPHLHTLPLLKGKRAGNLPPPRYGTYICSSVPTTLFHTPDILRLAAHIHGDLHLFRQSKQYAADAKRRKRAAEEAGAKEIDRLWAEAHAPFQLAATEGTSKEAALDLAERLIRESGVPAQWVMDSLGPLGLRMRLELRDVGL